MNIPPSPTGFQRRSGIGAGSSSAVPGHTSFRHRNGDRRDTRETSGRSRHHDEDVFSGYCGVAGDVGGFGGKSKREGDDGFRERPRFGGNGHSKATHKKTKGGVNNGVRPRNGPMGSSVP